MTNEPLSASFVVLPPPPFVSESSVLSAPPIFCDKARIYAGQIAAPLLLDTLTVNGGSVPFHIMLPSAGGGMSPWENSGAIFAAMDRTETMMVAAYEHILTRTRGLSAATAIVVEVGVHEGWFASVAHHYGGYQVVAFDMQPLCALLARCTSAVNGAARHVIFNSFVGHGAAPLRVGDGVCGGGLGVGTRPDGATSSTVPPTHLARFFAHGARLRAYGIPEPLDVALLKSDTEGYEPYVLETALPMLARVRNILIEMFPSRWVTNDIAPARGFGVLRCLIEAGMEAVDLPRKDIDFTEPGEIDLRAPPLARVHATWPAFKRIVDLAMEGRNGLVNPNIWFRWGAAAEARRVKGELDLATVPACAEPLRHALGES
jgi:hypothetical protein